MKAHAGVLKIEDLNTLFTILKNQGYELIGPKVMDQAITYAPLENADDLPIGYTDAQDKGQYKLSKTTDQTRFHYNIGARSWKHFLFPPHEKQFTSDQKKGTLKVMPAVKKTPKYAFIGVRSCELHAIFIQDKVFESGPSQDEAYTKRREQNLIVAVNCTKASSTCFCVSMNTGPFVEKGYDLALTEIIKKNQHVFLIEAGSPKGETIFKQLLLEEADKTLWAEKTHLMKETQKQMGRTLDTQDIKETLYKNHDHLHWDDVAKRCINCANCTLACPTCFCSSPEEKTELGSEKSTQSRVWDSCFSQEFTYVHHTVVRESAKSRYRQWMTHKLASWIDQFGTSGCVGCGRCITWCPVGIDITEEYIKLK